MPRVLPWLIVLGACGPSPDDAPHDDTEAPDTDLPTDSPDSDVDTEAPHTDDTEAPGTGAVLVQGAPVVCANPAERTRDAFARVTAEIHAPDFPYLAGGGTAAADFDGDGRIELVAIAHDALYLGTPTRRALDGVIVRSLPRQADRTAGWFGGLVWDADDDGDLDLLVTGMIAPSVLLLNRGDGTFVDGTEASGLVIPPGHHAASASAADVDGDGDLDVVVAGYGHVVEGGTTAEFPPGDRTLLFIHGGGGTYADATERLPAEIHTGFSFVPAWIDADADGDDDLYLLNDFGRTLEPNRLVLVEGGAFRLDDQGLGLDVRVSAMGIGPGDLDGDGQEDLVLSDWGGLVAMRHAGRFWFDATASLGMRTAPPRTVAWGNEQGDLDNDGDLDVVAVYGYVETTHGRNNALRQPDLVLERLADGSYRDRSADLDLDDTAPHRGLALLDVDRDGWLDLFRVGLDGVARLDVANCGDDAWLRVELRQPAPNAFAVGASVRVRAGGRTWLRRIRAGGTSLATGLPPEVHVGLGDHDLVEVEVTWPDGAVDTFLDVPTRRPLRIERP